MSIKNKRKIAILSILISLICLPVLIFAQSSGLITLFRPQANLTYQSKQVIEGTVEQESIKRLSVVVEPFVRTESMLKGDYLVGVREGHFREEIGLFPGLNIIKLASLGGKHLVYKPIFLIDTQKEELPIEQWGRQSAIVFTQPQNSKVSLNKIKIEGVVTDPVIKNIAVVSMNATAFMTVQAQTGKNTSSDIEYQEVAIENMKFSLDVNLNYGLNIIMAKPLGQVVDLTKVQVKSIIYERSSSRITLAEPQVINKKIYVQGKVLDRRQSKIHISVQSLVSERNNPLRIYPELIFSQNIAVAIDGAFSLEISLPEAYIIKSPPNIVVESGNSVVTRVLLKW